MTSEKVVMALSGGLDSATLLAYCLRSRPPEDVHCFYFAYGSKHEKYENNAAVHVAAYYGILARKIDLSNVFALMRSDLLKTGGEIPEGHYEAESMKQTVVPGRNLIFASVLAGIAQSTFPYENSSVWLGVHAGDHAIYPDCRPDFLHGLNQAVMEMSEGLVSVTAPLLAMHKSTIVAMAIERGVPVHLTRTCYGENELSCGRCGACVERREAFALNMAEDSIPYAYTGSLPKKADV